MEAPEDKVQRDSRIAKQSKDPLANLYEILSQLKLDILEDLSLFQKEEFQELRNQIREVELAEANRVCSLARVKWLGVGDEPSICSLCC